MMLFLFALHAAFSPVGLYAQTAQAELESSGYSGVVAVYHPADTSWQGLGLEEMDEPALPASTFKIFSTLVALETGVIEGPESILAWDGVERSRPETNRDLSLRDAFRVSAVPHYQHLVRTIGVAQMQHYLDAVGYGNQDLSGGIDQFWLRGGLRITAREQIRFLERLYNGDLPFSERTLAMVRDIMVHELGGPHVIRAKTGWASPPEQPQVGWWVGWVEFGSDVWFFATRLTASAPGPDFGPLRISLTRRVLHEMVGVAP